MRTSLLTRDVHEVQQNELGATLRPLGGAKSLPLKPCLDGVEMRACRYDLKCTTVRCFAVRVCRDSCLFS